MGTYDIDFYRSDTGTYMPRPGTGELPRQRTRAQGGPGASVEGLSDGLRGGPRARRPGLTAVLSMLNWLILLLLLLGFVYANTLPQVQGLRGSAPGQPESTSSGPARAGG